MTNSLTRKRWIYLLMALCLFVALFLGILHLAVNGRAHVQAMSSRQLQAFSNGPLGSVGQIYDRQGKVLFSPGQPVDRCVYSLVGSLTPMISNSVANRYQERLMGRESYSLRQGAKSLEGAGADLHLTLDGEAQRALTRLLEENHLSGLVAACDATTGAIRCMVSTPAAGSEEAVDTLPEGALVNKGLRRLTMGSTMKLVTTTLLVEQAGPESLTAHRHICQGQDTLSADGSAIVCSTQQGEHTIVSALGVSCNTYFASAIQKFLSPEETTQALTRYGLAPQEEKKSLGLLTYAPSQVSFPDKTFPSVWSLMGQVSTVAPLDLLRFTAAVVHQGQAPTPYLVALETNRSHTQVLTQTETEKTAILAPETAGQVAALWKQAYETYYDVDQYSPYLTAAKTGTAQQGGGRVNKLLLGYSEPLDTVFLLCLENWREGSLTPQAVSNCLLDSLADGAQPGAS